jgi:AAA+ superfamily predicted ATPase
MVDEVDEFVQAAFPAIWIQSNEHTDAIRQLIDLCSKRKWEIAYWDHDKGLEGSDKITKQRTSADAAKEPKWYGNKALPLIQDMQNIAKKTDAARTLFVFKNFHRDEFTKVGPILQAMANSVALGKTKEQGWCAIILAPLVNIPTEWQNLFVVVNHELPDREELWDMATKLAMKNELPKTEEAKNHVLSAAIGMSRSAADGAFALSIVKGKPFDPQIVQSLKGQSIKQKGLLTLYEGDDTFDNMGGLHQFREYTTKLLGKQQTNPLLYPKGLLLLGVPGSGKSQAVKCLGNATGRPVLSLDVGSLRSKFQGETDSNTREALKIADAMAPCILFIDEIEKALSGVQSSGLTDGGTGARMFGSLLTWLNDHKTDVFFCGTCNDISQLMAGNPEFARAERFDGMFFFDLPLDSEREAIWNIYLKMYGVKKHPPMKELIALSQTWTGAEIRTCCRLSAMMDQTIEETSQNIVPIIRTAGDRLGSLREWADGMCMSASESGLYHRPDVAGRPESLPAGTHRRVQRPTSTKSE